MQRNVDIFSGKFVYVYFKAGTNAYLIDMITDNDQQNFLRVLESSSTTNTSQVYRIDLDINVWWQLLVEKKEMLIELKDININTTINNLKLQEFTPLISKLHFQKMYFPFLTFVFSKIPTLHTAGPVPAKYQLYATSSETTTALMDFYSIKNLLKSRWIYIAVVQDTSYFELAIAPVPWLTGALWLLKTTDLTESHISMHSFMIVRNIEKSTDKDSGQFDFWEIVLGLRKPVTLKISYAKDTFQTLWVDMHNLQHTINTTLEAKIDLILKKGKNRYNYKWERCLFELNGDINSLKTFFK